MFYAELMGKDGEEYIKERGIFFTIEEFVPYRKKGWEGTAETNKKADEYIEREVAP